MKTDLGLRVFGQKGLIRDSLENGIPGFLRLAQEPLRRDWKLGRPFYRPVLLELQCDKQRAEIG